MSHTLTRRNVSAIAKLDLAGLGHAQRIEAIAKAIGFETGAALMATLKIAEVEPGPGPVASTQIRAVFAYGSGVVSAIDQGDALRDAYGNVEGDVSELTFATKAELEAYNQGLADADGWEATTMVASDIDTPTHPYLIAAAKNPGAGFVDWYEANAANDAIEDKIDDLLADAEVADLLRNPSGPGRASTRIVGYQLADPETGEHWADRASFEILDEDLLRADLKAAIAAGATRFKIDVIHEDDIEEPTFL